MGWKRDGCKWRYVGQMRQNEVDVHQYIYTTIIAVVLLRVVVAIAMVGNMFSLMSTSFHSGHSSFNYISKKIKHIHKRRRDSCVTVWCLPELANEGCTSG